MGKKQFGFLVFACQSVFCHPFPTLTSFTSLIYSMHKDTKNKLNPIKFLKVGNIEEVKSPLVILWGNQAETMI